jgi:methyl-accepting chemotaxis protein
MTWLECTNTASRLVGIGLLVMLLHHGQESRDTLERVFLDGKQEREQIATDLAERAHVLEVRVKEIAHGVAVETEHRSERVQKSFEALNEKIDVNTAISSEAATASHQAEVVANDVNAKIQNTNDRVTELAEEILKALRDGKRKP